MECRPFGPQTRRRSPFHALTAVATEYRPFGPETPDNLKTSMSQNLQVMKFGGTSVGDAQCIRRAAEIVAAAARQTPLVAVVSAMGGVTNRLIKAAQTSEQGDEQAAAAVTSELRSQHATAISALVEDDTRRAHVTAETASILQEVANLCRGTAL